MLKNTAYKMLSKYDALLNTMPAPSVGHDPEFHRIMNSSRNLSKHVHTRLDNVNDSSLFYAGLIVLMILTYILAWLFKKCVSNPQPEKNRTNLVDKPNEN